MPSAEPKEFPADRILDITGETCPMTFVRTRVALDRLPVGGVLHILLRGDEPRRNIPATAVEQGHILLRQVEYSDGTTHLWLQKG